MRAGRLAIVAGVLLAFVAGCYDGARPSASPPSSAPPITASEAGGGSGGTAPSSPVAAGNGTGGSAAACSSRHLALQIGGSQPADGTTVTRLFLRNAGTEPCMLQGFPDVIFLDRTSKPTGQPVTATGPAGAPVTLAPTHVASSVVRTPHATCTPTSDVSQAVRVVPPGGDGPLQTFLAVDLCGPSTVTAFVEGTGDAPSTPAVPPPDPVGPDTCSSAHLALAVGTTSAAAGTRSNELVLRNAGTAPCRLQGYPGVSLLDGQYRQVGQPAQRTGDAPSAPIVLAPGEVASARLRTSPVPCEGDVVRGLHVQVYPPGERGPLQNAILAPACGTPLIEALSPGTTGG